MSWYNKCFGFGFGSGFLVFLLVSDLWHWNYKAWSQDTLITPVLCHATDLPTQKARCSEFSREGFKNKDQG